jgi:outer membrane protein assembly factor BamB
VLAGTLVVGGPVATAATTPPGGTFHPLTPARLMDTRTGLGGHAKRTAGSIANLTVVGQGGVPASGVAAVAVNVTVANAAGTGSVTAYPSGLVAPNTNTLSFISGRTVPGFAAVKVGTNGQIALKVLGATTDLIVDVQGWFSSPETTTDTEGVLMPLTPSRLLDTRTGNGTATGSPLAIPAQSAMTLQVSGRGGVPVSGASGVTVNATVVNPVQRGYLTLWPTGGARPNASNLNYAPTQTVANRATVGLGSGGQINLYNSTTSPLHVVLDVSGWFTTAAADATGGGYYTALAPVRTYVASSGTRLSSTARTVQLGGQSGVPSAELVAVMLTATASNATERGNIRTYPADPIPTVSDLNFVAGISVANAIVAKVSSTGSLIVKSSISYVDAALDVSGYFRRTPPALPPTITTTSLTNATRDAAYTASLSATGGTGALTWALHAGTLPAGLSLSPSAGSIAGTPTATGTSNFTVRVTDASNQTDTHALTLTVVPPPAGGPTITTTSLPPATKGVAYDVTLAATGGTGALTWELQGTLPGGMSFYEGQLYGTPTATGTANLTAVVTDENNLSDSQALTLTVVAFTITTASPLTAAILGKPYSLTLTTVNGTSPYSFEKTAGTLPSWLSLNAATGALTGTPSGLGTSNFTITAYDNAGLTASKAFALTVGPATSPFVLTEHLVDGRLGQAYSTSLAAGGGTSPYTWSVVGGALPTGITLAPTTGVLTGTPTQLGTSSVTFRVTDANSNIGEATLPIAVRVGSDWRQPHYDMGRTGNAAQETAITVANAPSVHAVWSTDEAATSTAVAAGVLYVAGSLPGEPGEQALTAYDITTRTVLWRVRLNSCGVGPVSLTATVALLSCNGKLRAYSLSGAHELLWDTADTDAGYGNHIEFAVMSNRVIVLESDKVLAYSLTTGNRLWRQFLPEGASGSQVAVGDTTAVVAASDRLIAYDTATSTPRWTVMGSAYSAMVDDGEVYAAVSGELRKYTLLTGGSPVWSTATAGKVNGVLAGNGDVAIVLWREDSDFGPVTATHAYSESDGSFVWESYTPNRAMTAAVAGTLVWVTTAGYPVDGDNGGVYALNLADGELVHQVDSGRRIFSPTAISDGRIVVARSSSLRVYGLDQPLPTITTKVLRSGHVGLPYADTLTATGGTSPYAWSVVSGTLPSGVSLTSSGVLSGTPTAAGSPRLTIRVTDALGAAATRSLVVQVGTAAAGSWATTGGNMARTGLAAGETVIGIGNAPLINSVWSSAALPTEEAGDLAVSGDLVYVSAWQSGTIRAYNRTSGATSGRTPVWTAEVDDAGQDLARTGITVSGGRLLVGTYSHLYSFNALTGVKQWKAPYGLSNSSSAAPIVVGTRVVVGDSDGYVRAFNLADGSVSWTTVTPEFFPGVGRSIEGLATDGTRVYATSSCSLYAITATTGAVDWKNGISPSGARNVCAQDYLSVPLVADGIVYAGSQAGTMAYTATTGEIVWARTSSSGGTMAMSNGVLLITTEGFSRFIRAVDALTGALVWSADTYSAPPNRIVVAGDLVLSPGDQGIYGLDIRNGNKVWTGTAASSGSYLYQPAVADGVIYHVGYDHVLRAYGIAE